MKWTTTTEYIDTVTGEVLPVRKKPDNYLHINKTITFTKINENITNKHITYYVKRDNQLELFE